MFRKIAVLLVCVFLFQGLGAQRLHAASAYGEKTFEIGPYFSTITYEEPGVMKEDGKMYGLSAALTWHNRDFVLFDTIRLEALGSLGKMDYTSPRSGSIDNIDDTLFETRALLGDVSRRGTTTLFSYIGFGYRNLKDKTGGLLTTTGYSGYDRESQYFYIPLVVGINANMDRGWSFDGVVEYDYFVKGKQRSCITQANNAVYTYSGDVINDQHDGYGLKFSMRFTKRMGNSASLAFEPFLNYWNVGMSDYTYGTITTGGLTIPVAYYEPANNSTELGLKVLFLF
jgi:hypothetical protein